PACVPWHRRQSSSGEAAYSSHPRIIIPPPNGAAAELPPPSTRHARAPANTRLPASSNPTASAATRGIRGRARAAIATPWPKAITAAACSTARSASAAAWEAYAASATPAPAISAPLARSQRTSGAGAVLTAGAPRTQRAAPPGGCGAWRTHAWRRGLLAKPPEHLELAVHGERVVDAVLVDLERTVGDLVAMGQRPGADRVAHVLQLGHVALVLAVREPARLGPDVLDRRALGDLDLQLALVHRGRLGHRLGLGFSLVAAIGGVGLVRALAAHRLDHVEGVVLAAQLGGDDAHRAGRDQVVGVHRALDPLAVGPHRALDGLVVALDRTGRNRQQVLGGQLDHAQVGQRHALGAVVHVRHRGQDAGELGQADLHVLAHVAAHVHAGVAPEQVPAVVHVVGLADLDVAPAAAGRTQ